MATKRDWVRRWETGDTPWVDERSHQTLVELLPKLKRLGLSSGTRVLIPLCGNSAALKLFHELGCRVTGVDLVRRALRSMMEDRFSNVTFHSPDRKSFTAGRVRLVEADFLRFEDQSKFGLIYDRAALVAIPRNKRRPYVRQFRKLLCRRGLVFLDAFSFEGGNPDDGPPFPVTTEECDELFEGFKVEFRRTLGAQPAPEEKAAGVSAVKRFWTIYRLCEV